ncbi:Os08g0249675 [Oryza sativa Japonica Group]|uniref:Os08g0249675 protein n=1 Tax=Oryza sativa subsp. japonica TaxID=39947 RepID=A0A0P0XDQ4_ORYSJ|nr:Os08g0249675 [Oryza sativa Japonica Group]
MESCSISNNNFSTIYFRYKFGDMMAIMANSEVLDYPNGHIITCVNQSKCNCHLLTMTAECIFLLFFFNIKQNFLLIRHITFLQPYPTINLIPFRQNLFYKRMGQISNNELVNNSFNLHSAASWCLINSLLTH